MTRATRLAIGLAAAVALAVVHTPAHSQAWRMMRSNEQGWMRNPQRVTCEDLNGFTHLTNHVMTWYLNPSGDGAWKDQAVIDALRAWTEVPNADFDLRWGGFGLGRFEQADGYNTMVWDDDPICDNDSCHAITGLLLGPGQVILQADIQFNAHPSRGFQWMTNGDYSVTPPCWETVNSFGLKLDTQGIATHELGHALGIDHPTNYNNTLAVMGDRACTTEGRFLKSDDLAALRCSENRYPENPAYQGALEAGGCRGITGWAWNANRTYQKSYVEIVEDFFDGTPTRVRAITQANRNKPGLAGLPDPYHGFSFDPNGLFTDGRWHLVRARYSGNGASTIGNSFLMVCGLEMFPRSMTPSDPPLVIPEGKEYEVGTTFKSDHSGYITEIGYYFHIAESQAPSHTVKLWKVESDGRGTLMASKSIRPPVSAKDRWSYASVGRVRIEANQLYRASIDTYEAQAKSSCGSANSLSSPYSNHPLTAVGGAWVEGVGGMPTVGSCSNFFVSVKFESG